MFGEKLKEVRENIGMTQKQLADKIGVNRATIAGYEAKGKKPSYATLIKIAQILNCTTDFLLGLNDNTDSQNKTTQINSQVIKNYEKISQREDLQLLLQKTEDLHPNSIKRFIKIIDLFKEEKNDNR